MHFPLIGTAKPLLRLSTFADLADHTQANIFGEHSMSIKRTLGRLALIAAACGTMAMAQAETTIAYITNGNT